MTPMKCYACKKDGLKLFLSLGHQPPSDAFLKPEDMNKPEETYPLDCYFCPSCTLIQLGYAVDPEILFREYVYNTGSNNALRVNFHELVEKILKKYQPQKGALAVDVGSNDGTLLENYIPHGLNILGIDPSSATSIAIEKGIPTLVEFFNKEVAEKAVTRYGKAQIITATNVFAHVVEIDSFMDGVVSLLADDGVFITESLLFLQGFLFMFQFDAIKNYSFFLLIFSFFLIFQIYICFFCSFSYFQFGWQVLIHYLTLENIELIFVILSLCIQYDFFNK